MLTATARCLRWLLWLLLAIALPVLAQSASSGFDHSATSYPLLGKHEEVRCESCHLRGIFRGTPRDCATCHAQNNPRSAMAMPTRHVQTTQQCDSCHSVTGFTGAIFTHFSVSPGDCASCHDGIRAPGKPLGHLPTSASCDQCHSISAFLPAAAPPANHIPFAVGTSCSACHTNPSFAVQPSVAAIHANAPSTTSGCADCHGDAAASFSLPNGFAIVGRPANHIPTSGPCEVCHVGNGSGISSLPVGNAARFSGAVMNHVGIASGCAGCHLPAGSSASFVGISAIVGMPPTSPPGSASHIPSGTACESCHLASTPSGVIAASATKSPPGTGFGTPAPTGTQIHNGVTSGCSSCHDTGAVWMGMGAYPISPTTMISGATYNGFQTRPRAAAGAYNVADAQHPNSGDCSQCHGSTTGFTAVDKPANHIPYAVTAQCNSCHTASDFGVMPTLADIHLNAPSSTSNCAQCHGAAAASFAIPAANFSIVGQPSDHIPTSAACETCHVGPGSSMSAVPVANGAKFSNSLMSHSGISGNCVACHVAAGTSASFAGITRIVAMPPTSPVGASSHIPSGTACETCHLASLPGGLIAASATRTAPGTGFGTPVPSGAMIHTGITGGCSSCHDTNAVWMGMSAYPIVPSTLVSGASYNGFHSRPRAAAGTFNVADPAHPASGDCSQCHGSTTAFSAVDKPANHIPYAASASCDACHTSSDFGVVPSIAAIHANAPSTTNNCAQCHGSAAPSFAIPGANFSIVGQAANHIPTTAACETCHVGAGSSISTLPVANGAKFSGSLMNHAGISSNCVACHVAAGSPASFAGITRIVGMPPTSPAGASSHIPSGTACESCHLGSLPAGFIAASATTTAPGTGFATPAPSGAQIHAGVTSGCAACHEAGFIWMGVGAYPISPSTLVPGASYNGFQTRPRATGSTYGVPDPAHPSNGDCSQCHGSTTVFTGVDKPANHIPYAASAQCNSCHTNADYGVQPSISAIHANAPSTNSNCAQCHGAAAASFAIPAVNFAIVGLPANHIPTAASCEVCHVGLGSSVTVLPVTDGAKFAGSLMNHAGIAGNCVSCHLPAGSSASFAGIARIVGMPPTSPPGAGSHIPSSSTCESCHVGSLPSGFIAASATKTAPGTGFASPAPTGVQIHAGITSGCSTCHEGGTLWMGMGSYPIAPTTLVPGASYTGFQTRPRSAGSSTSVPDPAHPVGGDCSQCHGSTTAFTGVDKPANHIPYAAAAQCNSCHTSTDYSVMPTLANIHANAPSTTSNCAQCHGAAAASFAIPAANFSIVGQPANHIPTSASCELCHVGAGSSITALPVANGAKFSGSLMNHAGIGNNCVTCHVPASSAANFAGIASIVGMPPTSGPGAGSHIPSGTACETCHLASLPSGLIAASATKSAPGTGFGTPAPSGAQIHTGVTSGCSACHEAGYLWMGVSAYPISPTTLIPGASYNGFQTRPRAAGSSTSVPDPAHPTSGDCSQCHGSTTAFSGVDKPANHIPYAASAQCNSCHTGTDYAVQPTLANIHANAPSTTSNCGQCHGAAAPSFAIPGANFSIVGLPANHIPTTSSCEVCHVGAGSSITVLPVANGAKFSGSLMSHTGIGSNCVSCHVTAGSTASFAGISRIVGMPATSPVGASSHIPSGTACETCHLASLPSGLIAASASKTAPGTAFGTPAPSGAQIHTGVTSGCAACHEAGYVWMGVGAYPISPSTLVPGASYNGFQTRPRAAGSTYGVPDPAHPSSGDCSQCHGSTTAFTGVDKPANHIPYASSAQCNSCHTGTDYSVMPTLANIHANAPSTTNNCAQCHGAAAPSFAIPGANFSIVGLPANHIPTTSSCEVCHVGSGSSISVLPVGNGAQFSGSLMNHAGIANNCAACHQASGSTTSFTGITRIVGMPPTSPVGASSHIPSGSACESCHLASLPSGLIPASATKTAPGTGFGTPAPSGAQIHAGVTSGCSACHEAGYLWMGVSAYPISPTTLVPGASYNGFQTRPRSAGSTYSVPDPAHPSSGDCSQCHGSTSAFTGVDKPANHIPYASSAQCNSCHTGTDYAVMPTLANIHAYAPSTTNNCAQCHGAAAPSFAIPQVNFSIVGLPSNHIPTTSSCEVCHVGAGSSISALPVGNGAKFAGSLMNHAGIASNCAACHVASGGTANFAGITAIVGMPPTSPPGTGSHIPSGTACESCHLASLPSGLIAASATKSAPGTGFGTPAPSGAQIHAGVSANCSACHDSSMVWMGMSAYPISPSTLIPGALYTGFQTRPRTASGSFNVADPAHPSAGDCAQCHASTTAFSGVDKPANHIPYAPTAQCNSCHTNSDYAVLPTLADIHTNAPSTSSNCAQCHGAAAPSFAIPGANFSIVGLPANHIPTSASCEVCHVGAGSSITVLPVANGAKFSGSLMNHQGIGSNCANCHQPSGSTSAFTGITRIVGMPPTSPMGSGAHIPSATTCESCHLASLPIGPIPSSATKTAPGTGFGSPAPSSAQIHAGVTGGCSSCHEGGYVWMGIGAYPIAPTTLIPGASYTGFQTRPRSAGSSTSVPDPAHPSSGDCSQCHGSTSAFTGVDKPANHIPYAPTAQCNACHTSTDYAVMPTLAAIHANAPSSTSNCAQCHGAAAPSFAIPSAGFSIVGLPSNHIPTASSCEQCHVGAGSSISALPVANGAKFSGSTMNHLGISTNCASCHLPAGTSSSFAGITSLIGMPPTSPMGAGSHIPSSTTCESCHLGSRPSGTVAASATTSPPGTGFATPAPTGTMIHAGVSGGCSSCHESNMVWMGMSAYPISPNTLTTGAQYKGFQTRPRTSAGTYNVADPAHPGTGDCSQCHGSTTAFSGVDIPGNHIPFAPTAQCNACHTNTDYAVMPTLANIHANAPSTTNNCAQCHGAAAPSFAIPGVNFSIVGLPANHIPTTASCEVCHVGTGSSISSLPVANGAKFSGSLMNHAGIANNCVACHVAAGSTGSFAGITRIVGMPPTSPAGAGSHIPSGTACESCHLGSLPAGLIAASATKTAPGTAFATPAPTGAMIHAGVSANCSACHDTSMVWMGVSAYPIAPTTLVPGASYTGFQTRPRSAAGTYNVADPAHPGSGDCSACHGSTTAFTGVDKPANHIPYAAAAQCNACHTGADYAVMPTLANIHANAPSTTSNCAQCHGPAAASFAIPSAGFSIVGLPANHIPTTASCEVCHVGAGSSISVLPVGNGAKFAGSLMNHAGIASNCASCHVPAGTSASFAGITRIVGMPATAPMGPGAHIPSGTTCESCHLGSLPSGLIPSSATKTAPGTGFSTPAPSGVQIHAGVSTGCSACHETSAVWMGVGAYPISPTTLTPGAQYKGFQTRPTASAGTYNVADPAHPSAGDCSQCHGSTSAFTGVDVPSNHIPIASSAQCSACHTSSDYAAIPTLANIHANAQSTTNNCVQCHGPAAPSFAIPSAGFSIVGLPSNHIPTTATCEVCHVGTGSSIASVPVGNGASFAGSLMSHSGISSNCVACHVPSGTSAQFIGIGAIVNMPAKTPVGPGSHIPSNNTCETCHLASLPAGQIPSSATKNPPGTGFASPAPTGPMIHTGVSGGCEACHEASYVWVGVGAYPISPNTLTPGASYKGFQTRPRTSAGTYNVADPAHPAGGDCVQCHASTTAFSGVAIPANHIPFASSATCNACHTNSDYAVQPSLTAIHANAPSTSTNCAQCHGAAAPSFAIPSANFSIVGLPAAHIPTSASCEVCHVGAGSSISATPVVDGAKFSASLMNHAGISAKCSDCHVTAGTTVSFTGITRIVGMPPTSPAGTGSHIPSATTCESCHLASLPSGLIAASASKTAPGTAFATPAPTGVQIHAGVSSGCSACHDSSLVWMGMSAYPISPSTLVPGAAYHGFQTRPGTTAGTYSVADPAHPAGGDCVQCHASTLAFSGVDKPANHIPYANSAQCNACHTNSDYAVMPTLANIHANAPSTSSNCAQCHGPAAPSFAIPSAGFSIVGLPANHIPTTASCEVCHVGAGSSISSLPVGNGAKFSGSLMSHAGIGSNCAACHQPSGSSSSFAGITRIVGMPPTSPAGSGSHIPSGTACESCHLASLPAGFVPASATKTAPGTDFATPAPSSVQIHAGVSGGCSACHDSSLVWMGMSAYPISPSTLVPGASYTGFQTRPRTSAGTYNVADPAHPASGDCSLCHASTSAFTGVDKPANHIPYSGSAQCSACHTSSDYSVLPTLAAIHANAPNINNNCAQCHGAAAPSFAIPSANFSIVGLPANHIPTTSSCEVCHVGTGSSISALPVGNGASFANSQMNHSGISANCVACHQASGGTSIFVGITRIVGMPPTSPMGSSSHIPSTTSCESCHLASMPSGYIAASASKTAPGTAFQTPPPTGAMIHTGVVSGCAGCHEGGNIWMGIGAYPISPTFLSPGAQYTGFQTRPRAAASSTSVADPAHPAAGDCSQCHGSTTAFTGVDIPANHIPFASSATCDNCHTSTDYAVLPTLVNIHTYAPSTTVNCQQCHGAAAPSFAIPSAGFSIVGLPSNHLPVTTSCEVCHVGSGSSISVLPVGNGAKFSGSLMNHLGISSNCVSCHQASGGSSSFAGIARVVGMPPTSPMGSSSHIPSSTSCETCHAGSLPSGYIPASATKTAPGTGFATPTPSGVQIHTGVTGNCAACHDTGFVWMGISAYPISPTSLTPGAQYKGFQTRPHSAGSSNNIADPAHPLSGDCSQCHGSTTAFTGVDIPANHIPFSASAQCNACHTSTDYAAMPTLANIHANAQSTTNNCVQCHGPAAPTFAIPSAGFSIVGLPSNHIPTAASCEVCHVGAGSSISAPPVGNGAKFSGSLMSHSGISSNCVACHVTAGTTANFAGITRIVGMPPTSPMGASSHIPSSSVCESCHLATTPSGLIAASATKTAPGTAFATPAPTGVQIHAGVSGNCAACHDTAYVWMGVSAYPISPSTLTPGAQYHGFQTRPRATGGTYNIADAGHPSSGDCSLCHANTTAFAGVDKPSNHIPYATAAACTACHTSTDYAVMPTLANIHANAQSTTNNCVQCHGPAAPSFAIPSANFSIVGLPSNHIPTTASCEVCHVGAGSSITVLPVGNGAKFSGSLMSHTGIASNCIACHVTSGTTISFAGITRIVGMPPTSPVGASSHIPSGTTCESCHLGTVPAGLIAASATKTAPGTGFQSPAPTAVQIHAGVSSGCSACHEASYVWMGMSAYPIAPTTMVSGAQYTGFQTRPRAAGGTYNVADPNHPSTGDCAQCHTGTTYFSGAAEPAGHIPTPISSCSTCHIVTGDFSLAGLTTNLTTLHTGISSNCRACHVAGSGAGPFAGCTTQSSCPSPVPLTYQPKVMPLLSGGSPTTPSPSTHIPVGSVACESCHSATNFTTFAGVNMKPSTGTPMHTAVNAQTCMGCHEANYYWYGATKTSTPKFITRAQGDHSGTSQLTHDCSECHTVKSSFSRQMRIRPVMRAAVNGALPRLLPFQSGPKVGNPAAQPFDHRGVIAGQCQTCHNGQMARARPTKHYGNRMSCDSCHRTTTWLPAQYGHPGVVAGQCAACHNGTDASGKPGPHFVTVRACDSCHRTLTWKPANYQHLSPAYMASPDKPRCIDCHITNGEVIPRQLHGNPRTRPVPVPPPRPGS